VRDLQIVLGHNSLETTMLYLQCRGGKSAQPVRRRLRCAFHSATQFSRLGTIWIVAQPDRLGALPTLSKRSSPSSIGPAG
jgi:hypothetical protein